ncbi:MULTISPECIES: isoprenylcysteine carboxylmethyltransferase family protein [unclassified Haladaptatus]|nr:MULTISPECIES: isoprenylcysteine carboxylmethyltransferase family protein [unclassified Haladaptatus]
MARASGLGLIGCGVLLIGWAFRSVAGNIGPEERQLVTTGPYAFSRNPMYVGWTMLYAGRALLSNNRWVALLLPAVVAITHVGTIQEERALEREFGDEYRVFRQNVRRYL